MQAVKCWKCIGETFIVRISFQCLHLRGVNSNRETFVCVILIQVLAFKYLYSGHECTAITNYSTKNFIHIREDRQGQKKSDGVRLRVMYARRWGTIRRAGPCVTNCLPAVPNRCCRKCPQRQYGRQPVHRPLPLARGAASIPTSVSHLPPLPHYLALSNPGVKYL